MTNDIYKNGDAEAIPVAGLSSLWNVDGASNPGIRGSGYATAERRPCAIPGTLSSVYGFSKYRGGRCTWGSVDGRARSAQCAHLRALGGDQCGGISHHDGPVDGIGSYCDLSEVET